MSGSVRGGFDVLEAVETALQTDLQTFITTVAASTAYAGILLAPTAGTGYARGKSVRPQDLYNGLSIYVSSGADREELVGSLGAPNTQLVVIGIRYYLRAKRAELADRKYLLARAIRQCLRQKVLSYNTAACLNGSIVTAVDYEGESIRLDGISVVGADGEEGTSGDVLDTFTIRIQYEQRVSDALDFP